MQVAQGQEDERKSVPANVMGSPMRVRILEVLPNGVP